MKEQEDGDIDGEVESMQPRKLNWTKVLFDYHICLDAEAFQKWDGDLTINSQEILEKDIPRTRCEEPLMKKESFRQVLRRITAFYCKQNGVTYQQGLLEVVYPFALLRSKDFKTKKCYAYFNAFMRKHFPKVLVQRVVEGKSYYPYLTVASISLSCFSLLLQVKLITNESYRNSVIADYLRQVKIVRVRNLPIKFVYEIYDYFIQKNDSNYIFYMTVALIGQQEQKIIQSAETGAIHKQVQNLKKFSSTEDLKKWFNLAQEIAKNTPQSFNMIVNDFCFSNRNLLSTQDVDNMLKSQQLIAGGFLSVSIEEVNKDTSKYVLIMLDAKFIKSKHKYEIIQLNSSKIPPPSAFSHSKIYVLVAHEKNLLAEIKILTEFADKLPMCKFLILRQHLVDENVKKCAIF